MTLNAFLTALRRSSRLYTWQVTAQGAIRGHRDFVYVCPLYAVIHAHGIPLPAQLGLEEVDLRELTDAADARPGYEPVLRQALFVAVQLLKEK